MKAKYSFIPFLICLFICEGDTAFSQQLPIKPARTISFTTDEGSYMNVDVSPDGSTLLFDLLGDLYSVPVTGGNAMQLTRGVSLNLRPVWSPDGKRIAYISDNSGAFHLNVMDRKGTFRLVLGKSEKELNYGQEPLWTPDGNFIAIGDFVYGLLGGKTTPKNNIVHPIRFSAGGNEVYYLDSGKLSHHDFLSNTKKIVDLLPGGWQNGTLSPDGRWWVCFVDTNNYKRCLIVRDLAKNINRILVPTLIKTDPRYNNVFAAFPHCSFSPDSKKIFISYGGKIHRIDVESGNDQIVPFIANVKSDLGPYNYHSFRISNDSLKIKYARSATASPDGKHLVFSALDRIYEMNLPDGKPRVFGSQSIAQFQPVYSPDGKWIAYVSWCDTIGGFLWKVSTAGGQPEQLTSVPGQYQRPAWSPDSKFIAVVNGPPKLGDRDDVGRGQLELIAMGDGTRRIIDDTVPLWNQITFSNDRIIYQPKRIKFGKENLVVLMVSKDLEGKNMQIVSVGEDFSGGLQQRSISPDGRYIVYSAAEDLYLVPVRKGVSPQVIYDPMQKLSAIKFAVGVDPYWEKDGKALCWTYSNHFYKIDPDKILIEAEKTIQRNESQGLPDSNYITATVRADQVVNLNVTVPKFYARGLIALKNVRILTMKGNQVIEHGTIVIKDGRFIAIGSTSSVAIPKDARILDLAGTTVMPGLIDLHDHMRIPPNVFPQQSWMFLANLAYGVTTARDPALSFDSYGYKELLETGQMIGPRLYTVGRAAGPGRTIRFDNLDDVREVAKKRARFGVTTIKQYDFPNRMQRQWMLIASNEAGLNMTNEGGFDPIKYLAMIKDGSTGTEHNPAWGEVYNDVIFFVAKSHIYLTPTLQVCYGTEEAKEYFKYKYWHQADKKLEHFIFSDPSQKNAPSNGAASIETILKAWPKDTLNPGFLTPAMIDARIRKHGGLITLGSHGNDEGIGAHNELWALQMGGLTNIESLQAATIIGAGGLGVQKDLGSIEVGKIADLIILNKNPLEDIHNSRDIRYVMKDGVLYDGNTLDEIWPVFKKLQEWKLNNK